MLRRLLRRAARHGRMLGIDRPFLTELVRHRHYVPASRAIPNCGSMRTISRRSSAPRRSASPSTIDAGLSILNGLIEKVRKQAERKQLSGEEVFKLNDTFGFPLDLTREIAAECGHHRG